ncbi:MAG: hypothetical protein MUC48_21850 [Leptolyngbya sp. Prado105]|jgi:ABC-type nitrate/sulfonate/bicarbonate transport system permease component|nr:hypothetical protein [Leptolyngbya sp. Prado105]
MPVSLYSSLWATFVQVAISLVLSTALGSFIGWFCTRTDHLADISKRIFRGLSYFTTLIPVILFILAKVEVPKLGLSVFLSCFCWIALYATLGIQTARQNQNQWHLAIPSISLGIRIALLLSWATLQFEILTSESGIGRFLWNAYNSGKQGEITSGIFATVVLAFLIDQVIDLAALLLSRKLNSQHNSIS